MKITAQTRTVITTGLALFAMFFGAGNMIFPLQLGVASGQHAFSALIAFVITGVGVPFLGLFAVSLYEGNYWKFFSRIGKTPAFLVVTFLILIIGPLFAAPRTEIVTFNTILPVLPAFLKNAYVFDGLYFLVIFALVCKQTRVVDIIGYLFSPVKLIAFSILIIVSIYTAVPLLHIDLATAKVFNTALTTGYNTMDLLAAVFFCTVAYKNIVNKCKEIGITAPDAIMSMTLKSCVIGAVLISMVYAGFIFTAAAHAGALQNIATESLIEKISFIVLGQYGALFVCICVSFACLATCVALAEVSTDYLYTVISQRKIPRIICLLVVLVTMYMMAILGFAGIMSIAVPVLNVVYPLLIVYCVISIVLKLRYQAAYRYGELEKVGD